MRFFTGRWLIIFVFSLVAGAAQAGNDSMGLLVKTARQSENPAVRVSLLKGMLKGLEGQRKVPAPDGWAQLSAELMAGDNAQLQSLARELGQIFGDEEAALKALALLGNQQAKPDERRTALKSLLAQQNPGVKGALENLLRDPELRIDAIRAFGKLPGQGADQLLKHYSGFSTAERRAVVETLATRKDLAGQLVAAIEKEVIAPGDIPAYTARLLTGMLGEQFTRVYGDLREQNADKAELIAKYSTMLDLPEAGKADPVYGRAVYARLCGVCHRMYGEGGILGPDLTGSNRANRDYILLNIIDPNFDVPDGYKMVILKTKTNQVLAGTIGEEDELKVVLNTVSGREVVAKVSIKERQTLPISMMPEGMLETISKKDFFALIKYLQTEKQTEKPKP
jgi:putative heme-binding domain-containing protein